MKKSTSLLATLMVLASALPVVTKAATQVYDLKDQWSDTQNPNGTWSYRDYVGGLLLNDPYSWVAFYYNPPYYADAVTKITDASVVPGSSSPPAPGSVEIGDVIATSALGGVVARWTAPASGTIDVSGSGWPVLLDFGELGTGAFITTWGLTDNGSALSSGNFSGSRSTPSSLSLGIGGASVLLNIPVQPGDEVELHLLGGPAGLNFTVTFTPDAVDPVSALEDLAATVAAMNLQNGIENSLDAMLDSALNALDDVNEHNDVAACNSLDALINAVEAQRGDKLTDDQADELIASAQQIQSALNCGN